MSDQNKAQVCERCGRACLEEEALCADCTHITLRDDEESVKLAESEDIQNPQ